MTQDYKFLLGLLETAKRLYDEERRDVHYTELADAYFNKPISGEAYQAVRARLPRLRALLEDQEEIPTILVGPHYYGIPRGLERMGVQRPEKRIEDALLRKNEDETRRCLPIGRAKSAHGLYWPREPGDPIEIAALDIAHRQTRGRLDALGRRLTQAQNAERLPADTARDLLETTVQPAQKFLGSGNQPTS
jgi:hypothetical protein